MFCCEIFPWESHRNPQCSPVRQILHNKLRGYEEGEDDDVDAKDIVTFHDFPLDDLSQDSFTETVGKISQLQAKVSMPSACRSQPL